jgi:DNA-directed RNA polymerase sigma subunit (sigma70/sigma32)
MKSEWTIDRLGAEGNFKTSATDSEEDRESAVRAKAGDDEAFRQLIESNLRFALSVARKYARSGYTLHELINEGNMGQIEAACRFDPGRGCPFHHLCGLVDSASHSGGDRT